MVEATEPMSTESRFPALEKPGPTVVKCSRPHPLPSLGQSLDIPGFGGGGDGLENFKIISASKIAKKLFVAKPA